MNDVLNKLVVNKCLLRLYEEVGTLVLVGLVFGRRLGNLNVD